ncbi:MAG: eCIS core domain-containing protein [Methylocystis sp.]|uniref:eCIS core domain-containing protein n=1 Tax=Methylocystis sp. TaxID=1911079 RepID=UPI003DA30A72
MAAPAPPVPAAPAPKPPETKAPEKKAIQTSPAPAAKSEAKDIRRAPAGAAAPAAPTQKPVMRKAAGDAPGGVPVSSPADPAEREATAMASKVMRSAVPGAADGGELAPMRPKESLKPPVSRAEADAGGGVVADPAVVHDLGPGAMLDAPARSFFEPRFGADLSHVRIHTGDKADRAAKAVRARAFTVGRDIAFASGEYDPESPGGRELLAHELVHVLQNGDDVARMVMRDGPALTGSGESDSIRLDVPLGIPRNKGRHAHLYHALAASHHLNRPRNYDREEIGPDQVRNWNNGVAFDEAAVRQAGNLGGAGDPGSIVLHVAGPSGETSRLSELTDGKPLMDALKIPQWNKAGRRLVETDRYDVDHIVELQVGGQDSFDNYELFRGANNRSVGGAIRASVERTVLQFLVNKAADSSVSPDFKTRYPPTRAGADRLKADKEVQFPDVEDSGRDSRSANRQEASGAFWTRDEIRALAHVRSLLIPPDLTSDGTATQLALYSPSGQLKMGSLPHGGAQNGAATIPIHGTNQKLISGLVIENATATYGDASRGPGGSIEAKWDLDSKVFKPGTVPEAPFSIPLTPVAGKQHAAAFAWPPTKLNTEVNAASPIALDGVCVVNGRLDGRGLITPSLPFLEGIQLPARLDGRGLRMSYMIDATALVQKLRLPRVSVNDANLTLFIDEAGAGAEGFANFSVEQLGEGTLFASMSSSGSFELSGAFVFDTTLFDEATVALRFAETGFTANGRIGVSRPNKIRGLRSASASVVYDQSKGFSVEGVAQPNIPGVRSATLRYASGPEGQTIEGDAALDPLPGLQGGQIGIKLRKQDGDWKLAASGQVTPNIPGVTTSLEASYDDGAFTIGGRVGFERGILKGEIDVGATNKPVDPDGRVLDGAPTDDIKAFGSGALTARITDHLQGTVGLKRRPSGQILITGRIGVPSSVELFGRYPDPPWEKTLLNLPTVNIPIFGGGVGSFTIGISATIGGALTATAYVGPGTLENANIGIEDYDPTNETSLRVTGHALFAVPAYAGLRLGIDAGITGGAGVISVTGGMNIGAEMGVQARAAAEADLLWTPAAGLSLQATLMASAEPKLRFTVGAFAKADVSLLVTSFTIYRKDWQLASFEYGPALRVGLSAPIAYRSGSGVDFDFSAIQFQLPSISPRELIGGLLDSQGRQETHESG